MEGRISLNPGRKSKPHEVKSHAVFVYERNNAIQDSRYRNQSAAGAFADGGRDRYFVPSFAKASRRRRSDCV